MRQDAHVLLVEQTEQPETEHLTQDFLSTPKKNPLLHTEHILFPLHFWQLLTVQVTQVPWVLIVNPFSQVLQVLGLLHLLHPSISHRTQTESENWLYPLIHELQTLAALHTLQSETLQAMHYLLVEE